MKEARSWNKQKFQVSHADLNKGDNIIRFSLPEGAEYSYTVKNIKIRSTTNNTIVNKTRLVVNTNNAGNYYNDKAYFQGFVTCIESKPAKILVDGKEISSHQGKFEYIAQKPDGPAQSWDVKVEAVFPDGRILTEKLNFNNAQDADYSFELRKGLFQTKLNTLAGQAFSISLEGASLEGLEGSLLANTQLSVTALRRADMTALAPDMINVTAGFSGYRFLPHGTNFSEAVDLSMNYDPEKIPQGYTEKDIRTYYFDENTHNWVALGIDTTDAQNKVVKSKTTHFTDMINAIIQVPESPGTMGYTPTTMSGIKAANPMAGIVQIAPPGANPYGSANMSFPIKIPAGRRGMQPGLGISYNSGGGNGWLGLGWDLSTPSITIDTRWGVPHYDPLLESETYTMGGEQLYPVAHRSEWKPREENKRFYPRVEGSFARIIRHGIDPKEYWWEVTDKSGTKYFYGGTNETGLDNNAVLKDYKENVAHWSLTKVQDLHGNFVRYHYKVDEIKNGNDDKYPSKQIYSNLKNHLL